MKPSWLPLASGCRRFWRLLPAAAAAAGMAGAAAAAPAPTDGADDPYESLSRMASVLQHVRRHYVDGDRVAYRDLVDSALKGLVSSLDEHSEYMSADEFRAMQEDTAGQFGGIGVVVGVRDGILTVISPIDGTPGERAGLRSGDRLVEIEGRRTDSMALAEAVKLMRGLPGTRVRIRVAREGREDPLEMEIERADIRVDSVAAPRLLDGGVAVIRISQFDERTARLLDDALAKAEKQGAKALVLDLRNNPGGLLDSAVDVCGRFLPRGRLVLSTQGRAETQRRTYLTRGTGRFASWPMAVLINEGSASAAEVVAGCLQDHRRAVLVGERSFGKGSVQTLLPIEDGAALRLTTALYLTPNRRRIHNEGIEPDILVPFSPRDFARIADAADGRWAPRPLPARDPQLDRAADAVRGLLLLGSAGSAGRPR